MEPYYSCKLDHINQLKLFSSDNIRWINISDDFPAVKEYYLLFSDDELNKADFPENKWKFCAIFESGKIISFAGILYMTDKNWELGAVSTHPQHRNRGYATMICSFAAKYILENKKQVTCSTKIDNYPMQNVMKKIGMVKQ
ncbi:MAG: GNAT family N-acetyltransferase [Oscillospiraceae bacterium]|nr:GNAT family N-acetyltransferase [Oscillospiraceae bacterium]